MLPPRYSLACVCALVFAGCASDPVPTDVDDDVASVLVSPDVVTLEALGETAALSATARTASGGTVAGASFAWSSSDETVAIVSASGVVTAVANGSTEIVATADGVEGAAEITVDQVVAELVLSPADPTVTAYGTLGGVTLSAVANDALGSPVLAVTSFTWESAALEIARVSADGEVVTLAAGNVDVTASADGVSGSTTVTSMPPAVPTDGLMAHFPFTDGALDRSGGGHDGTAVDAVLVADRFGNADAAYEFDGADDYIELAGDFADLSLPFTFSAWLLQDVAHPNCCQALITLHDPPSPPANYYGFYSLTHETFGIAYGDGGFPAADARRSARATEPLAVAEWVHVAATVRGPADMTLYTNGIEISATYSGTGGAMVHNAWPTRIGRNAHVAPTKYWEGLLDDLRIYDRSLSAQEILQLFHEGGWN